MSPLPFKQITATALCAMLLAGCNAFSRISQIGEAPPLTTIQDPKTQPGYTPVSLPMPTPIVGERQPNSLWKAGSRAFFKDQRAANIGDILTVVISIDDKAQFANDSTTARTTTETDAMPQVLGFDVGQLAKMLPKNMHPNTNVAINNATKNDGTGGITREEKITLNVAALVTQVLPNGNLVVQGRQEIRVNFEVRELQITGVLRPQDISSTNTTPLEKLAEARVSYGGRGQITDKQQPRYGQQLLDVVAPF